jgi:uncharacterized protein YrrD
MAIVPEVIKHSELLNQVVLNRATMEELGRVEILWMYPPAHRVLGFICKSGFLGNQKTAFKLSQIEAIGGNGILTHSQPDATDAERVRQLESLIHSEVWSNAGERLGKIIDCVFNARSGSISDYLIVGDRLSELTGTIYRLPSSRIASLGRKRVLVSDRTLQAFPLYREGIQQKISKATSTVKQDYTQATQEVKSIAKRAQETTLQTTSQLKNLAEQAKDRAQLLAEQAQAKAQELNDQIREGAETLVERIQEQTEQFGSDRPRSDDVDSWFEDEDFEFEESKPNVTAGFKNPENRSPDDLIIEEIEEIFEEIEEIFGVPTPQPAQPLITPPNLDSPWIEDLPWSAEKVEFWDAKELDQWDVDDKDDPWNITELPPPTTLNIPFPDSLELQDEEADNFATADVENHGLDGLNCDVLETEVKKAEEVKAEEVEVEVMETKVEEEEEEEARSPVLGSEPEPKQTIVVEVVEDEDPESWI